MTLLRRRSKEKPEADLGLGGAQTQSVYGEAICRKGVELTRVALRPACPPQMRLRLAFVAGQ